MSIELVRNIINFEKLVGEGTSQTMVNGDIILGERSPEIANILNVDGKVIIAGSEVVEDKIIVEGKMLFEVLYSSTDENGGIYKVNATSNFNHNIQIPGALPKMSCKIKPAIEHLEYDQMTNRKIKVNAIINVNGLAYEKNTVEAITDIKGQDVQVLKDKAHIDEFVAENNGQSIIKGKAEAANSEINSILKSNVFVHKKDVSVEEGKAVINACARIKILYDTNDGDVYSTEQDVPFTSEVEVPDLRHGMKCDTHFKIEDVYDEIKENENGERKIIESEVVIGVGVKAYGSREFENIVDAYSPVQRYEIERENIKSVSFFGEGAESENIKERITIPEDFKPIGRVKNLITNAIPTDIKAIEDKVIVEGIINCCIVYLAAVEEGGIVKHEEDLPFKIAIDVPGTRIDMIPEVDVHVADANYDMASDKNVDVKMTVESNSKVYNKNACDIAKGVVETELPDSVKNMPSIVIYTVQPQDTLWKIAKKYSTTIEDIVALNEIENPDMLMQGMKLLIPKKMFMR